jgi:hypothetical protein
MARSAHSASSTVHDRKFGYSLSQNWRHVCTASKFRELPPQKIFFDSIGQTLPFSQPFSTTASPPTVDENRGIADIGSKVPLYPRALPLFWPRSLAAKGQIQSKPRTLTRNELQSEIYVGTPQQICISSWCMSMVSPLRSKSTPENWGGTDQLRPCWTRQEDSERYHSPTDETSPAINLWLVCSLQQPFWPRPLPPSPRSKS